MPFHLDLISVFKNKIGESVFTPPSIGYLKAIIIVFSLLFIMTGCSGEGDASEGNWFTNLVQQQWAKAWCTEDKDNLDPEEFCSIDNCRIGNPEYCCEQSVDLLGWAETCKQPACQKKFGTSKCCSEIRKSEGCLASINSSEECMDDLITETCDKWWIKGWICRSSSRTPNEVFSSCWSDCQAIHENTVKNNLGVACAGSLGMCSNQVCADIISEFEPDPFTADSCQIAGDNQEVCSQEIEAARCPEGSSACIKDGLTVIGISLEDSEYLICPGDGCTTANAIRISPDLNARCSPGEVQPCGNLPCSWDQVPVCSDQGEWDCLDHESCLSIANLTNPCDEKVELVSPDDSEIPRSYIEKEKIIVEVLADQKFMFDEYKGVLSVAQFNRSISTTCERHKTEENQLVCRSDNPGFMNEDQEIRLSLFPGNQDSECLLGEGEVALPVQCSETPNLKLTGIEWNEDFTQLRFSFTSDYALAYDQYSVTLFYRNDEYSSICSIAEKDPYILSCMFRVLKIDTFPRPAEFVISSESAVKNCVIQDDSYIISKKEIEQAGGQPPAIIGRWSGYSDQHGNFTLIINSIDKILELIMVRGRSIEHNDYKISGCIDLGQDGVITPVSGILRYEDDITSLTIVGTELTDQQGILTSLAGTIISEGEDYRATSGSGEGTWRSIESSGEWSLELDQGSTACDFSNLESEGLWLASDVSQNTQIGEGQDPDTHFLTKTNIACGSMQVTVPAGYSYDIDLVSDTYSTGEITEEFLFFHRTRPGEPDPGRYSYACLDILGKKIGALQGVDYFSGCDAAPPTDIDFEITPDGILVTWNPGVYAEEGDQQDGIHSYRLELRFIQGEEVYVAEDISETSHLIPFSTFPDGSPGYPDGVNYDLSLDDLEDGRYSIGVLLYTAPEHPDGSGVDCALESLDDRIIVTKSGGSWW